MKSIILSASRLFLSTDVMNIPSTVNGAAMNMLKDTMSDNMNRLASPAHGDGMAKSGRDEAKGSRAFSAAF